MRGLRPARGRASDYFLVLVPDLLGLGQLWLRRSLLRAWALHNAQTRIVIRDIASLFGQGLVDYLLALLGGNEALVGVVVQFLRCVRSNVLGLLFLRGDDALELRA